jgi:hypothetical protein
MTPEQQHRTFFFEGNPVGYFVAETLPYTPGQYQYMPYRGPGHYKLGIALQSAGPQQCYYIVEGKKRQFKVLGWDSYGLLNLSDFEQSES